jgi:signal transduction histidine kinase
MPNIEQDEGATAPGQAPSSIAQTVARIGDHLPYAIAILRAPDFSHEYINTHYQALAPDRVILHQPFANVWPELTTECLPVMRGAVESGIPVHAHSALHCPPRRPDDPREPFSVSYSWIPISTPASGTPWLLAIGALAAPRRDGQPSPQPETVRLLAAGIAHDFNNLLTTILGYAWLGLAAEPVGSRSSTYFSAIRHGADQAAALTRQLLAYAGQGRAVLAPIQLSRAVSESARALRLGIPPHIELKLDLAEDLPEFTADPHQIEQLLTNLVLNSVEAIGEHPGIITIRTASAEFTQARLNQEFASHNLLPGPYVILEVADTGPGIDPDILPRIFEPFFTTHFTGRGLGLAAVDGIVRACRGGIRVNATPGHGYFRIYLPAGRLAPPTSTTGH